MADERSSQRPQHRIAKLLARAGIASRREVERMIAEGRVARDGTVIDTPATVLESLHGVTVDGQPVAAPAPARLFLFHKPVGVLTTERDPGGRATIYDRLPRDLPRLVPVGRLDLNTEGLLLLTTDGGLKRQLELPATGVERSYRARAYGAVTQAQLEELIHGVEVDGVRYGAIDANLERRTGANVWIELTLREGKNREVRRVLEYLGLRVGRLIRTRYGPFVLGDLPVGGVGEVRAGDLAGFRQTLKSPLATRLPLEDVAVRDERRGRASAPAGAGTGAGHAGATDESGARPARLRTGERAGSRTGDRQDRTPRPALDGRRDRGERGAGARASRATGTSAPRGAAQVEGRRVPRDADARPPRATAPRSTDPRALRAAAQAEGRRLSRDTDTRPPRETAEAGGRRDRRPSDFDPRPPRATGGSRPPATGRLRAADAASRAAGDERVPGDAPARPPRAKRQPGWAKPKPKPRSGPGRRGRS
ncbi:pseudouridine synthase [Sphingomonas sp. BK235]|uniref:pseudouridine synthase n=1 Tax=Sphingomonas sp. BK235 TaxID=2512131 RepID=UPI00104CB4DC|nr:pseudouridine synthase [Sphingomonas sp. BK235]TCP32691.1 23S rRNA pseudouridine2605 synthase [Sphingomonas sp. BK235]